MANDAKTKIINALNATLSEITKITPESLVREDLGPYSFKDDIEAFKNNLILFNNLKELDLYALPQSRLNDFNNKGNATLQLCKEFLGFDPKKHEKFSQAQTNLLNRWEANYDANLNSISFVMSHFDRQTIDYRKQLKKAISMTDEIRSIKEGVEKDSADILETLRSSAGETGTQEHENIFGDQAVEHSKKCTLWLWITLGFVILTLWFAYTVYSDLINLECSVSKSIQIGIAKLIIFSILYSSAIWSGKNYKAHWHNTVVNKHRQNALNTFGNFVNASRDDRTKDAVLLQATQSIFAPQSTGFISHESDSNNSPQFIEVVRAISGTSTGDK
ncbi:hypothetical protein ACFL2X_03090 [Candidatus Latescibacterota bacterium]